MNLLVLNPGSSSLKYGWIDVRDFSELAAGKVERIGEPGQARDVAQAFEQVAESLFPAGGAPPDGIVHRVVHGGARFDRPTEIDAEVEAEIARWAPLAPLHQPASLALIAACRRRFPGLRQVAVFDTAFHHTLPEAARQYAIPDELARRHGVRRYGFHGISHAYAMRATAKFLQKTPESVNLISLHLGHGASACAIASARSVDTSMGMTPLEGLVMGTRCGDIDAGVLLHLAREEGWDWNALETVLRHESGLQGMSGAADVRDVHRLAKAGDLRAQRALDVYGYRLRKYIGAYFAVLGRVDALIFTGGVGEHDAVIRALACAGMSHFGIVLDSIRNDSVSGAICEIQATTSHVAVLVIRADEITEMAHQAKPLFGRVPISVAASIASENIPEEEQ